MTTTIPFPAGEGSWNDQQLQAMAFPHQVNRGAGSTLTLSTSHLSLVIEAGAGAGKTSVLTQRIALLLDLPAPWKLKPSEIYVMTFTEAAAEEIHERVARVLSSNSGQKDDATFLHVSTIDSFFRRLFDLKFPTWWEKNSQGAGRLPKLVLGEETTVREGLKSDLFSCLEHAVLDPKERGPLLDFVLTNAFQTAAFGKNNPLENLVSLMLDEGFLKSHPDSIRLENSLSHPSALPLLKALHAKAREAWLGRLQSGLVMWSDITLFLWECLCGSNPDFQLGDNILLPMKELIVDEYQDTSRIQHEILWSLAQKSRARMVVVGDPKQSIYRFRGSHVEVLSRLKTDSGWTHLSLAQNFRSTAPLLSRINQLSAISFSLLPPASLQELEKHPLHNSAFHMGRVHANPLEPMPGLPASSPFQMRYLQWDVAMESKKDALQSGDTRRFFDVALDSLRYLVAYFLRERWEHHIKKDESLKKPWGQVAILVETNREAARVASALRAWGLPARTLSEDPQKSQSDKGALTGLQLARLLAGPLPIPDILSLLTSPLFAYHPGFSLDNVEGFVRALTALPDAERPLSPWSEMCEWPDSGLKEDHLEGEDKGPLSKPSNRNRAPTPQEPICLQSLFPEIVQFFEIVRRQRKNALDFFSATWILLRQNIWESFYKDALAHSPLSEDLMSDIERFFHGMDAFALQLIERMNTSTALEALKKSFGKSLGHPFPLDIKLWDSGGFGNASRDLQAANLENSIEVLTVHKAKGLEWDAVFFLPKYKKSDSVDFAKAEFPEGLALCWEGDNTHGLSLLAQTPEPPSQTESEDADEEPTSPLGTLNSLEALAERQRVYYTALTRPRHLLALGPEFPPHPSTRNGHTLAAGKKGSGSFSFTKLFLQESFLKVFPEVKFPSKGPLPEPPVQGLPLLTPPSESGFALFQAKHHTAFWLQKETANLIAPLKAHKMGNPTFPPTPLDTLCALPLTRAIPEGWQWDNVSCDFAPSPLKKRTWSADSLTNTAEKSVEEEVKKDNSTRAHLQNWRKSHADLILAADKGLKYHAAMEHTVEDSDPPMPDPTTTPKSPLGPETLAKTMDFSPHQEPSAPVSRLRQMAVLRLPEYEIWCPVPLDPSAVHSDTFHTTRNIIDLLMLVPLSAFADERFLQCPIHGLSEDAPSAPLMTVQEWIQIVQTHSEEDPKILCVVDYKTGRYNEKNDVQMLRYLKLTKDICRFGSSPQLRKALRPQHVPPVIGLLAYETQSETHPQSPTYLWGNSRPIRLLMQQEVLS